MERLLYTEEREFLKSLKIGTLGGGFFESTINVNLNGHIRSYSSLFTDLTVISKLENSKLTHQCKILRVARPSAIIFGLILGFLFVVKSV